MSDSRSSEQKRVDYGNIWHRKKPTRKENIESWWDYETRYLDVAKDMEDIDSIVKCDLLLSFRTDSLQKMKAK